MAEIAIIGGAGFIGQYVSRRLAEQGQDVTVLDVKPGRKRRGVRTVSGDAFDEEALRQVLQGKDTVVDLVGLADIGECQRNPALSFHLNVVSLARVLEMARSTGVRRFVFPSSAAVYGKVETVPIDETTLPNPSTIYGWHKLMAEQCTKGYRQNYGLRYVILRLFNVIGEGNAGVIDEFVARALTEGRIRGFGRDQLRDFIHAEDVAQAFFLAATHPDVVDKVINVGTGEGVRIADLAETVRRELPKTEVTFEEKPEYIPYHSVADITLARSLLNFNPTPAPTVVLRFIGELVAHGR